MKNSILLKGMFWVLVSILISSGCNGDEIESVELRCETTTISVGENTYCEVYGKRKDGKEESGYGKDSTFTSSDENIAYFNNSGWINGRSTGSVTITADYNGLTDSENITVTDGTGVPTVSGTVPTDGETGVNIDTTIQITFSKTDMNPGTMSNISLAGNQSVGITSSYADGLLTITPDSNLDLNILYTVTIAEVSDNSGNPLDDTGTYTFSFTTGTGDDSGTSITWNSPIKNVSFASGSNTNFNFMPNATGEHTLFLYDCSNTTAYWTVDFDGMNLITNKVATSGSGNQVVYQSYPIVLSHDSNASITCSIVVRFGKGLEGTLASPQELAGTETRSLASTPASTYHYYKFVPGANSTHTITVTSDTLGLSFQIFSDADFTTYETVSGGLSTCWASSGTASCTTTNALTSVYYYLKVFSSSPTQPYDDDVTITIATP